MVLESVGRLAIGESSHKIIAVLLPVAHQSGLPLKPDKDDLDLIGRK